MSRPNLEEQLLGLIRMNAAQLGELWTRVADSPAPYVPSGLLRRFVAQRLQEKRHRGLPVLVSRELDAIAASGTGISSKSVPVPRVTIRPGTRLIREWNGKTIAVTAAEQGFEYDGRQFSSLTQIASEVTGTHWSGPRFFGVTKRRSARG